MGGLLGRLSPAESVLPTKSTQSDKISPSIHGRLFPAPAQPQPQAERHGMLRPQQVPNTARRGGRYHSYQLLRFFGRAPLRPLRNDSVRVAAFSFACSSSLRRSAVSSSPVARAAF